MACFAVPAAEAVITTVAAKVMESKEKNAEMAQVECEGKQLEAASTLTFSRKLKWLRNLLWGGSGLLAFEHVWHGEIIPFAPFLTAAGNPADMMEMLREMATVGTGMAAVVTAVWAGMVAVASVMEKKTFGALSAQR